jgi:hypothetical protein
MIEITSSRTADTTVLGDLILVETSITLGVAIVSTVSSGGFTFAENDEPSPAGNKLDDTDRALTSITRLRCALCLLSVSCDIDYSSLARSTSPSCLRQLSWVISASKQQHSSQHHTFVTSVELFHLDFRYEPPRVLDKRYSGQSPLWIYSSHSSRFYRRSQ